MDPTNILQRVHICVLFGDPKNHRHILSVQVMNSKDTHPAIKWSNVNEERVQLWIDNFVATAPKDLLQYQKFLPAGAEKQFMGIVSQLTFHLLMDLFCDERMVVKVLGHRIRWQVQPMAAFEIEEDFASPNRAASLYW